MNILDLLLTSDIIHRKVILRCNDFLPIKPLSEFVGDIVWIFFLDIFAANHKNSFQIHLLVMV